jgi:hypothetical protein
MEEMMPEFGVKSEHVTVWLKAHLALAHPQSLLCLPSRADFQDLWHLLWYTFPSYLWQALTHMLDL